jgi:hypothetical protein
VQSLDIDLHLADCLTAIYQEWHIGLAADSAHHLDRLYQTRIRRYPGECYEGGTPPTDQAPQFVRIYTPFRSIWYANNFDTSATRK